MEWQELIPALPPVMLLAYALGYMMHDKLRRE